MWVVGKSTAKKVAKVPAAPKADLTQIQTLFKTYITPADDPNNITLDGISNLCDDLEIDPTEDVRLLVLCWKLDAKSTPGCISETEWETGSMKLGIDSIAKLKALLPQFDAGFLEHSQFKSFFKFCFLFSREGTHRTIEKDLVCDLMRMVLKGRENAHLEAFCGFLGSGEGNARITLDQWTSFLEFSITIPISCKGYDEDENCAWPVLIDEYVEWQKVQFSSMKIT